ncbi:zinc finger, CCHC-type containing protein [Tanacetum coccineum]|uniref:Zinc finger, CCHC-type containing protein n=1 Tax=Tanacetum coccineum TaxID=301880 RepID=A0ABQ4X189_9ASTR
MLRMTPKHVMKQRSLKMLLYGKKPLMMRWIPSWATTLGCWLIYLHVANLLGFRQKSGIDYFDTYAPVARISTIRLLIAMALIHNMIIHQMDVKTTFLNGELDEEVDLTKELLSSKFSMKDMGEADVIIGIRIKHESNRIAISQSHYIGNVLKKFNYFDYTPVSTPMDTSEKLMPNKVGKLSRYTSNPSTQHWQAIQRVLKYLKKTMDYSLVYTGYSLVLEGYTDTSWISNNKDNSSTSGWVFLLGGGAISWASKKQIASPVQQWNLNLWL